MNIAIVGSMEELNNKLLSKALETVPYEPVLRTWQEAKSAPKVDLEVRLNGHADGVHVTEARGYVFSDERGYYMPCIAPSFAQKAWVPWRLFLDLDLAKAAKWTGAYATRNARYITQQHQIDPLKLRLLTGDLLSVDIENTKELELSCVSFSVEPSHGYVIPCQTSWQRALVKDLCESDVPKVLQNGMYDRYFCSKYGGFEIKNQTFDTMLAWHALQPELAGASTDRGTGNVKRTHKSLRFLSSLYTFDKWWKDYDFKSDHERWHLNAMDTMITLDIAQQQIAELEAS